METTRRVISILMSVLLLCGCSVTESKETNASDPKDQENPVQGEEIPLEEETEAVPGWETTLPETDMEGYSFRVLTLTSGAVALTTVFQPESETGEILNDAIYRRNLKIADLYNVSFSQEGVDDYFTPSSMLKNSVMAGSDDFDLYYLVEREAFAFVLDGFILRPDELPYIDPSQPWYFQDLNKQLELLDIPMMVYGADSITSYENSAIVLFNKSLFEREQLGNPYDWVREGTWTIDSLFSCSESVARDLNSDGKINDMDQVGIVSDQSFLYSSLWIGAELPLVGNIDGEPVFFPEQNEALITLMQKILSYKLQSGIMFDVFYDQCDRFSSFQEISEPGREVANMIFSSGGAAFRITSIGALPYLREMEDDYGILPLPKLNEAQQKYHTRAIGGLYGGVPSTTLQASNISIILEALAAESYSSLMPAFCETVLKVKYSRDLDSKEMMELILKNLYQDLSDAIYIEVVQNYNTLFTQGKDSFASETATIKKSIKGKMKTYLKKAEVIKDALNG